MPRFSIAIVFALVPFTASAAEIAVLNEATWSEFVPAGKEVDAIYGDIVLRNDKLVAVIANPVDVRNANMTVKNVGGCLIDFTLRDKQNDQLPAFYPLGKAVNWREVAIEPSPKSGKSASGKVVVVRVSTVLRPDELAAETKYVLADGADYLTVGTMLTNLSDKPIKYAAKDETNAQGGFAKGTDGELSWIYDRWWDAAYGLVAERPKNDEYEVPAKGTVSIARKWFVASDLASLRMTALSEQIEQGGLKVFHIHGYPIRNAYVEVKMDNRLITAGKTSESGVLLCGKVGKCEVSVSHPAYGQQEAISPGLIVSLSEVLQGPAIQTTLIKPGTLATAITDEAGGPVPCKVKFVGVGETKDPVFFDKTGEHAVGNLYYSHDGKFTLDLPPGKYDVTVSHGPEYDAVFQQIEINGGSQTPLAARLVRSVQTPGWVSADFHNHASPSGDNTSSQFGRVLNLLAEHLEFAPCTEHNRVSSYQPHLTRLQVAHRMATCTGIELTGTPFSVNHQNAFPIRLHEHRQDGGGPTVGDDPDISVERLALWDDRSPKLIQQNHPDIGYLFFDRNGDGRPDEGFQRALGHLDCIEVHPPHRIFDEPTIGPKDGKFTNNPMFNWLQLLNQGYRLPGVVNTDAHYNIHGSGWLRNYIACSTDEPGKIDVAEMVHAAEHGRMVMTNAPFLEATVRAGGKQGGPGDDVAAPGGKAVLHVRVQCANWYDIDRVQVFVNGKPDAKLNFTRKQNPDAFGDRVVKFDRELPLELASDAHVIVAAIGEHSGLGPVMGPEHEKDKPTAVTNPIFVDVDGGGFTANKDTLGVALPVKAPGSK